jgi:hypothetical protein
MIKEQIKEVQKTIVLEWNSMPFNFSEYKSHLYSIVEKAGLQLMHMVKVQFSILNEVFYNAKNVHPHGKQNRGNVGFIPKTPCRSNEHGGSP